MKCPVKKCRNPLYATFKKLDYCNSECAAGCAIEAWKVIRRAQRLIREVPELMAKHGYSEQYQRWIIRAVEIGAMKESK